VTLVFVGCSEGSCRRGAELVPCEGPDEPGWVYVGETGWFCPEHAWAAEVLPWRCEGPETRAVAEGWAMLR
jgi:hypothetical protein